MAYSDTKAPAHDAGRGRSTFKSRIKDVLRPLASALPDLAGLRSWPRSMGMLQRCGFAPVTVFDIGVGYGTFPLYRAFPGAFYHLVDPARESLAYMQKLSHRLRCEIHPVALADHDGEAMLEVREKYPHPVHWAPFLLSGKVLAD